DLVVANVNVDVDTNPDLVFTSLGLVSVMLSNGNGSFANPVSYYFDSDSALGGNGPFLAVSDLNGDHKPDLVVAGWDQGGVLLGNGDGTFQNVTYISSDQAAAASVVVADLDGDGYPDIVVSGFDYASGNGKVGVFLRNSDGTFKPPTYVAVAGDVSSVAVA